MVDFKLPLYWLITGLIAGLWTLISMWFSVSQLVKNVADLQITIANSNSSITVVLQEVNMMKYRQSQMEAELTRLTQRDSK
jgi:hypothetical protein